MAEGEVQLACVSTPQHFHPLWGGVVSNLIHCTSGQVIASTFSAEQQHRRRFPNHGQDHLRIQAVVEQHVEKGGL